MSCTVVVQLRKHENNEQKMFYFCTCKYIELFDTDTRHSDENNVIEYC